jgi:amino acid adenylation domain-containing protein
VSGACFRLVSGQISEIRHNDPQSIALSYGDRHLSFEEFDNRADRFAGHLAQLGVASGDTVAICMERSFDWIVAALGIMRAGAAYVPLDSAWPDSRLRFAVDDSGATVLVGRAALLDRLNVKARGTDPRRDAAAIAAAPGVVSRPIEPDSLAYVIYTSGSTGVPKGVEITHSNLSHLIQWHQDAFGITRQDRASHLAGLGFDAAVWELWPHLTAGATMCLADDAVRTSPELMQQWMIRERVTIGFVPTVHAAPMMAMDWPSTTALRVLLTGGDALHRAPTAQLPFEVVNNYGPTECTVVAASAVLKPGSSHGAPPIGRPIAGTSIYLLDEQGEQVPDGSTGEIYIGGSGVGRGYRNLPESTEHSFLPDPFAAVPSARMYRTGDRGVRWTDGQIEFRGRFDRQTNIRGQRVELDEIGSILTQHPSIDFAIAITNVSESGENELAAYVLPKKHACALTRRELQQHLLCSLPAYMIPAHFVQLHSLPLSPNGKLDVTMLPPPTAANLLQRTAAKAPATAIEETLLTAVRELLENNDVRSEDNFFLAGGHSLLGTQLLMRVQDAFGVDLTSQQLFEAPTVQRLAVIIRIVLDEGCLAQIWKDLLGRRQHVGPDDNFLDLGGHPELVAALQQRIAEKFGRRIPIAQLYLSSTLREQARLTREFLKNEPALPPGVLALHRHGTRPTIFWVHYVNGNLAKEMGDDQPFIVVTLTADDVTSLGESPTLQNVAACHLRKVMATQPKGPYIIGGQCLGGTLAYEIASQLQVAGHEVSVLVLLDPPNLSYLQSHDSVIRRLSFVLYLVKKAARLGLRMSLVKLRIRLFKRCSPGARTQSDRAEMLVAQEMFVTAARAYQPKKYKGTVLLLLAADRPPHMDFLPGWQSLLPGNTHTQYVDGHHGELLSKKNVRSVADAIASRLRCATDDNSLSCLPDTSRSTDLMHVDEDTVFRFFTNDEAGPTR